MNKDLTTGKPEKVLWQFCLPLFGSIIFQQLYNTADALIVSKFLGDNALAAVSASGPLVFLMVSFFAGAATGAADAMTIQMTRSAIATAVPVVGSIISEATGTVLAGAGMLKSAVGIFGMLAVLAICLTPFLSMAVQYLLYKLTAFLAGTVTEGPLAGLINALGTAFGLMLGMTGSCALLLLISITSSVSAVLP